MFGAIIRQKENAMSDEKSTERQQTGTPEPCRRLVDALVRRASSSSWARRLSGGRCLVLSIIEGSPMPDGVNDVVIQVDISFGPMRDETETGRGRTFIDILEDGWRPIGCGVSFADAMKMVGG
jgi:hypothetical protein